MSINLKTKLIFWSIAASFTAIIALWIGFLSIRQGSGVGGDATIYIASAQNLLEGLGLGLVNPAGEFRLIPYFPPLYPLFLAIFGTFNCDIATAGGVANIVLFAALVFLVSYQSASLTQNSLWGLIAGLFFAGSPILIPASSWVMSEPLATFLGFAGLAVLFQTAKKETFSALILSAILCGLSFLVRYSSASFIAATILYVLTFYGGKFSVRLRNAILFGVVATVPMLIWLIIDFTQTDTIASRSLLNLEAVLHQSQAFFLSFRTVASKWFLPDSVISRGIIPNALNSLIAVALMLFTLLCTCYAAFRIRRHREQTLVRALFLLGSFFFCYFAVIFAVAALTFPPITINARMFLPMYIAFGWLVILMCAGWTKIIKTPTLRYLLIVGLLLFCAINGLRGVRIAHQNALDGLGYQSVHWQTSETVATIRTQIPQNQGIVTNEETALLYLLGRATWPMHEIYVNTADDDFYAYQSEPVKESDRGRSAFQKGQAVLVVFDSLEDQMAQIYAERTAARIDALLSGLTLIYDGDDGKIFQMSDMR